MQITSNSPKRIYLDQSFWSDVYNAQVGKQNPSYDQVKRIYLNLQTLKARNKVRLVISDIHTRETSAFPDEYSEKSKGVWKLQNDVADGKIAGNWSDVFIAQHRRVLSDHGGDSYPIEDIGLTETQQEFAGVKIIMTNSWRLKLHREYSPSKDEFNNEAEKIITHQAEYIPQCGNENDCLSYIRGLWHANIQQGIEARLQTLDIMRKFEQHNELPSVEQMTASDVPFRLIVSNVTRGLDEVAMVKRWSEMLEVDSVGPCPSLRISTAVEAEMLWTWFQGNGRNPKRFNENFGLSRQNDINHVATFAPYVDALTTDNPMRKLCSRKIVFDELKPFGCRIYSTENYDEFENWLEELMKT